MPMYDDLDLEHQPRVIGTVVRRGDPRKREETTRSVELVALPPGTIAQDADAVNHYRRGADDRFYAYCGWVPSTLGCPIYVEAEDFLDPPPHRLTAAWRDYGGVPIYTRKAVGPVVCPECGSDTQFGMAVRGMQLYCCLAEKKSDCETVFLLTTEPAGL